MKAIATDSAVYKLVATQEHVVGDDKTGVWITLAFAES